MGLGDGEGSPSGLADGWRTGIRRVVNSAIRAMTASTDNDERSPAMRASAFSVTMASAVLGATPALSSAARRSLSDMNGMPPARSTCAWGDRAPGGESPTT